MTPMPLEELHSGDHLTRDEFERRYAAMPDRKAELIEGVVYVASPVSQAHADAHAMIMGWLFAYAAATPGWRASDNATIRIDAWNEPQPDACLRRSDHPSDGSFVRGVPPFLAEVAYTSAAIDRHSKADVYRRHGCSEYLVVTLSPFAVHWFMNDNATFIPLAPEGTVVKSRAFPGLWLDVDALGKLDGARLLATLRQGLAAREAI